MTINKQNNVANVLNCGLKSIIYIINFIFTNISLCMTSYTYIQLFIRI